MKICYFGDGESIHVVRWCKHFVALGHEVHLISFKKVAIEGVTVHFIDSGNIVVKGGNWRVVFNYRKVRSLLKKIKPDIFHAHYATSYGITGALCRFHPYIITTLGSDVLISGQESKIYQRLLKYAFSKADWIQTLAPHMSEAVEKIGADMSKVDVVPFGIDTGIFNDAARKSSDKFIITSTRNLEAVYNIQQLIKAVALIKNEIPNIEFRIAGKGSLRAELESLVKSCGIDKITFFLGSISQQAMVDLLSETNLFVSVSLSDGNNLSLAEAMACGAFCIGSDIPANRQWLIDGENGYLVGIDDVKGLADKMLYVYKNYNALQQKAVPQNKQIIQKQGVWEINMKRIEEKYKSLLINK